MNKRLAAQAIQLPINNAFGKNLNNRYAVPQVTTTPIKAVNIAGRLCLIIWVTFSHSKLGKTRFKM